MDNKLTNIKERILYIAEYKGIAKEIFFEKINMTYGNFKGKSKQTPINSNAIADILSIYPDINSYWLITGKGSMLKEDIVIAKKQDHFPDMDKMVPLVNIKAIGGFGNADFRIEESDIKDRYVIPKFAHKKIDFMIEVEGSSMSPLYNSGDIVACRIIHDRQFIQWNKVHVIASRSQGILIKRIKPANQTAYITMVSDNKDFDPFHIPDNDIEGIALVIGTIRLD
ncbi:MAG: hypothetical protein M9958_03375 [Chitinophagales bacterium]|nr:hypothetical protein [Chitinophagales bacterium]